MTAEGPAAWARSLPASVVPLADLWPAIERRLATRSAGRGPRLDWRMLAVAAALALAFVVAGLALRPGPAPVGGPPIEARAPADAPALAAGTANPPRFGAAEEALIRTKQQLRLVLAERRPDMSPRTAAVVDRNLAVIEEAIDEIRGALENDPTNPQLNRMLLAAHQRELALLQRVTHRGRPL